MGNVGLHRLRFTQSKDTFAQFCTELGNRQHIAPLWLRPRQTLVSLDSSL